MQLAFDGQHLPEFPARPRPDGKIFSGGKSISLLGGVQTHRFFNSEHRTNLSIDTTIPDAKRLRPDKSLL